MGCIFTKEDKGLAPMTYDMAPIRDTPVIFVSGVPGAGSHTVAQTISSMTGYLTINPGDLVRREAAKDTARGRNVAEKINEQAEVSEQIILDLVKEEMLANAAVAGFILVGFPKTPRMSAIFNKQIKKPEKIVALQVDDDVAAARLQAKLSELGRPEVEINAAKDVVKEAAPKVKNLQKKYSRNSIVTVDNSNEDPSSLNLSLKDVTDSIAQMSKTKLMQQQRVEITAE